MAGAREKGAGTGYRALGKQGIVFLLPLRGLFNSLPMPRLAPWAAFFRRFAADFPTPNPRLAFLEAVALGSAYAAVTRLGFVFRAVLRFCAASDFLFFLRACWRRILAIHSREYMVPRHLGEPQ